MDGKGTLDQKLLINSVNMKNILLAVILLSCCAKAQDSLHFEHQYLEMIKDYNMIQRESVYLTDSLAISYISIDYDAQYENGGWGIAIILPKDTTFSKICNLKGFNPKEWKKRNEIIHNIKQTLIEAASKESVEIYFDVYFFYTRQEYLYVNGGVVDDEGVEWPNYSCQDDAPIEEYKLENGKWILSKYIPQRGIYQTDQDFGLKKAKEILIERFSKIAEEMESKK